MSYVIQSRDLLSEGRQSLQQVEVAPAPLVEVVAVVSPVKFIVYVNWNEYTISMSNHKLLCLTGAQVVLLTPVHKVRDDWLCA